VGEGGLCTLSAGFSPLAIESRVDALPLPRILAERAACLSLADIADILLRQEPSRRLKFCRRATDGEKSALGYPAAFRGEGQTGATLPNACDASIFAVPPPKIRALFAL